MEPVVANVTEATVKLVKLLDTGGYYRNVERV
jgi:hypothetical protein